MFSLQLYVVLYFPFFEVIPIIFQAIQNHHGEFGKCKGKEVFTVSTKSNKKCFK